MGAYLIAMLCGVPLWVGLARRHGKVPTFYRSICIYAALNLGCVPLLHPTFIDLSTEVKLAFSFSIAVIHGLAGSAKAPLGDSIGGDVIDHDQSVSCERKHGTFFALWNLCSKSVGGLIMLITGVVLANSGFRPNEEHQPYPTRVAIVTLFGLFPLAGLSLAAIAIGRFELGEEEHARDRAVLRQRAREAGRRTLV